jgi:hypothetical protein
MVKLLMYNGILNITNREPRTLVWLPEQGIGYYPVDELATPYDDNYFNKYVAYHNTELGVRLNAFRINLVDKYIGAEPLIDIGVGCGSFVKARRGETYGYDINPAAAKALKSVWRWRYAPGDGIHHASFWDSLEHLPDPASFIAGRQIVFVSIPIFRSPEHVLESRHFNRNEHYWYFTRVGLIDWFERMGFVLKESSLEETALGREDIQTFVFQEKA